MNIFLITIDCLRADYIGCVRNEKDLTPNIDQIAKEGVLFSQAISPGPYTRGSFPAILSSIYPSMHPNPKKFPEFSKTIAEILNELSFNTIAFNPNPFISSYFGYDKGFEHFYDFLSNNNGNNNKKRNGEIIKNIQNRFVRFISKRPFVKRFLLGILDVIPKYNYLKPDDAIFCTQKILSLLNQNTEKVFFFLHYMDAHGPYMPPKKFRNSNLQKVAYLDNFITKTPQKRISESLKREIISLYKSGIRHMDEQLGIIFKRLKELNLYDDSLIIITSDHGDEFQEHGSFSHSAKLFDELIHIPLIIKGPNLYKNVIVDDIVSSIDIGPTIIEYLGSNKEEDFRGESLLPLLKKTDREYNRPGIISETVRPSPTHHISYRTKDWKLIIDLKNKAKELYNLKLDPGEQNNVYEENVDLAKNYEKIITDHLVLEYKIKQQYKERQRIRKNIKRIEI